MEPLYVHLAIWLIPVSKPNIQIQIETPFGKWQFHGSFSKYCELWFLSRWQKRSRFPDPLALHKTLVRMDASSGLSRGELLEWINTTLNMHLHKIEETASGSHCHD